MFARRLSLPLLVAALAAFAAIPASRRWPRRQHPGQRPADPAEGERRSRQKYATRSRKG